ncbi:type II toxin-antitoxin system VapB family antitoxin [Microcystis aeruginosa]
MCTEFPDQFKCSTTEKTNRLSYSLCDKFNLYSSDRSLCPLCLCGSFHSLARKTVS